MISGETLRLRNLEMGNVAYVPDPENVESDGSGSAQYRMEQAWICLRLRRKIRQKARQLYVDFHKFLNEFEENSLLATEAYVKALGSESDCMIEDEVRSSELSIMGNVVPIALVGGCVPAAYRAAQRYERSSWDHLRLLVSELLQVELVDIGKNIESMFETILNLSESNTSHVSELKVWDARLSVMTLPNSPTPDEIFRDLILGYARSQGMHIKGSTHLLQITGRFFHTNEVMNSSGVSAAQICAALNRLPNASLLCDRGKRLSDFEINTLAF